MAMELHGRAPTSGAGDYFSANVWAWRAIHDLMTRLCDGVLDDQMLYLLGGNSGDGPEAQETCTQMADRFEKWAERHPEGHVAWPSMRVTRDGRIVDLDELGEVPTGETQPLYRVEVDHLSLFVAFLRNCGGFRVW